MGEIPSGYRNKQGKLFPSLETSLATLDLTNPLARGHLIVGKLGTIPVDIKMGVLSSELALKLVEEFNRRTGLHVSFDVTQNKLIYK
jgi:hypothetical protein